MLQFSVFLSQYQTKDVKMDGNISIAVVQNIAAKDKKSAINILLEKAMELTHTERNILPGRYLQRYNEP
jgi:hypothetical protein